MGFAISLEYIGCAFALHSMSRAYYVAKVFHSSCPDVILAEVESVHFIYNLYLPKWVVRRSYTPELIVGDNYRKERKFFGSENCEKKLLSIKKNTADRVLKKAKSNIKILQQININQ